jgi:hypothetical protein
MVSEPALYSEVPERQKRVLYRWDLDKTYLSTDFDSLRGLLRTAFEPAEKKRTLPGANVLLRELAATSPLGVYILSGSPEQMRRVLEEKLRLDGIVWDGLVLKPSLNRLLRGRFRYLRDQVSYKLGALLRSRMHFQGALEEVMFGDDAEADAYVYSLYADLCAGRVDVSSLSRVLTAARAYDDDALELLDLARALPQADTCRRIFIHLERVQPGDAFDSFGPRVCAFHNYFQPALVLAQDGLLSSDAVLRVGLELVATHAFSPDALAASFLNLARRQLISRSLEARLAASLVRMKPTTPKAMRALRGLAQALSEQAAPEAALSPNVVSVLDYFALLPEDRARAHRAKHRHRLRQR